MEILVPLQYERKMSDRVISYTKGTDGSEAKEIFECLENGIKFPYCNDLFCTFKSITFLGFLLAPPLFIALPFYLLHFLSLQVARGQVVSLSAPRNCS